MSENIFEENNLFRDYKTDNFDDSDLQSRLYAEIYYGSNVGDGSGSLDSSKTIQFDSIAELTSESMRRKKPEDKQLSEPEAARGISNNKIKKILNEHCNQNAQLSNVTSIIDSLMYDDTLDTENSLDRPPLVEVQTNADKVSEAINLVTDKEDDSNSSTESSSSKEEKREWKKISSQKNKSSSQHRSTKFPGKRKHQGSSLNTALLNEAKHSKYNVLSKSMKQEMSLVKQFTKDKESSDSSDSEGSIWEIPVPPKPKPLLINLQDSDEENNTNSKIDNRIPEKITPITSQITGTSSSHQDTSPKNKSPDKSLHNKNTTKSKNTCAPEIGEDIVLHCTIVQKGAKSIQEIKQLARSAELNKNPKPNTSTRDTNKNSTQQLPQTKSKETNTNFQQETFVNPVFSDTKRQQTRYNLRNENKNLTDKETSCSNRDTTTERKRQFDNRTEDPKQKRQCVVQPNNQTLTQQSDNSEQDKRHEHFQTMSTALRQVHYDSSRGQENFNVDELQRGMSRDPRLWRILDEDLMPSPSMKQRNRFFNVKCSICHRDGHQHYDCPVSRKTPCCYICGKQGHVVFRCPQKLCLTCGHEHTQCPDLWRRYHQTTSQTSLPQNPGDAIKPPGSLHCCNCTKRGHESSTCREYRWSQHYQTPAAVTNYTNGPMYPINFAEDLYEEEIKSFDATSSSKIIQQPVKEYYEGTNETPMEETLSNLEVKGDSEASSTANKLPQFEEEQKMLIPNEINFDKVIYTFGKFHNKNHKNGWIITRDFALMKKDLSADGKKAVAYTLPNSRIEPRFLKTLSKKAIEFEVKIGTINRPKKKNSAIVIQVIAIKDYAELIYNLLLHWINLPDNEKYNGIDVTLPMSPTKMFNCLNSRLPQLTKMSFTNYTEHIRSNQQNDPQWLYNTVKDLKIKLVQVRYNVGLCKSSYISLRKTLWRIQLRLLMIVNTEPVPNADVIEFQEEMKRLDVKRWDHKITRLDNASYLKFTLLYNRLFVPHTPIGLFQTLNRFKAHAEGLSKNLPQTQVIEQKNKMDEPESLPVMNIQQDTSEVLIDNVGDTVNCNENEVILIQDSVVPSNIEALNYIEPVSILIENENANQLSTSNDINYSFMNEPNLNTVDTRFLVEKEKEELRKLKPQDLYMSSLRTIDMSNLSKKQKKKVRRQLKIEDLQNTAIPKLAKKLAKAQRKSDVNYLYHNALSLIGQVRRLNLPHLTRAANELQKKINDKTIQKKHVDDIKK
ncbi:uncharacterized protein LOC114941372 isoform X2 [Nylanderia fulva]|uniref:uncharacterized protein LOC114941372 isoform X2 n=1 Tax=Nylanderia fulva TaxID=613905 RepID=UPI0010FB657B|nr:uncharacterized protein LOC114941372 isoform X2 [Nylanderia fulva]